MAALLLALLAWLGVARADDAAWAIGLPVAQVSLEAAEGGLPSAYLEPLLRVRQGAPLDAGDVRQDVALLYRAGEFAAVEAIAEPWTLFDDEGHPGDAVRVTYRVLPSPRVDRIDVVGGTAAARRVARAALGVDRGEAFYATSQLGMVEARVVRALASEGWVRARVQAAFAPDARGSDVLTVTLTPGAPREYARIDVLGPRVDPKARVGLVDRDVDCRRDTECRVEAKRVRRWLRKEGVRTGKRLVRPEYEAGLERLRAELVAAGWLQARVMATWFPGDQPGQDTLTVRLELGPRLQLELEGGRRGMVGRLRESELPAVLGLHGGERMTRGTADEAARRVRAWFDRAGHLDAAVTARLEDTVDGHRLVVSAKPGPRSRLADIEVRGAQAFAPAYLDAALREADPEGLGRGIVSRAGIADALKGVQEFYRGQGFLETRLELVSVEPRARLSVRGRPTRVAVRVEEGPRTMLATLDAQGGTGLEKPLMEAARREMVDGPYSPSRLDALARGIVDAYRADGFLNADARVATELDDRGHRARTRIVLSPGRRVRLRSIVIQGNRRTRRRIVEREVDLEIGQPITPQGLATTRSRLYDLDLFRVVNTQLVGDDDRSRDLLLELDEKPNILLEAGGGLATDQGIRLRGRAAHRNIGGLGHKVTLLGQIGLQWASDSWRIDTAQPVWRAAATYQAPSVPGRGQELVVEGLLLETQQSPSFRVERSGGSVSLRARSGIWEGSVGYRLQVRRLDDVDAGALVSGDPWLPQLDLDTNLDGNIRLPSGTRVHAGPTLLLLADARNDRFNPTRGTVFSGVVDATDGLFAGLVSVRGEGRLERYFGLGPLVLDMVGRAGAGWAAGEGSTLPIEERFFLGGSSTLRGFRLNSVGPANLSGRPQIPFSETMEPLVEGAGVRGNSTHWVNTGGDTLLALTTELRVPLPALGLNDWDSTSIMLFNDLGRVAFLDPSVQTTSSVRDADPWLRASFGGGVRVVTPIGPAAIALGLNPWRIEAREEPRFLAHLSLGEL